MNAKKKKEMVALGRKIKVLRIKNGLTQKELAVIVFKATGSPCSQTLISQTEIGNKYVTKAQYEKIVNAMQQRHLRPSLG